MIGNSAAVSRSPVAQAPSRPAVGKSEPAARLIGWADGARERILNPRPFLEQVNVDQIIAACLAKMGEAAFCDAYDAGTKMTLDEAVAYSLAGSEIL